MMNFPDTEKKIKNRISSYKSALKKEKKTYGFINDGGGKRYLLFALYFVLNDLSKSEKYFEWFVKEFDDDVGEPIQKLCWAVSLFRLEKMKEAKYLLGTLMLQNLYIIPKILGLDVQEYDMWHSSSDADIDYYEYIPQPLLESLTTEDKEWIKEMYDSFLFRRIRQRYIDIFKNLMTVEDYDEHGKILEESYSLLDPLK